MFRPVDALQRHGLGGGVQQERDPVIFAVLQAFIQQQADRAVTLLLCVPVGAEGVEEVDGGLLFSLRGEGERLLVHQLAAGLRARRGVQNVGERGKTLGRGKRGAALFQKAGFTVAVQPRAVGIGVQRREQLPRVAVARGVQQRPALLVQGAEAGISALGRIPESGESPIGLRGAFQFADGRGKVLCREGDTPVGLGFAPIIVAQHLRRVPEAAQRREGPLSGFIVAALRGAGRPAVHQKAAGLLIASEFPEPGGGGVEIPLNQQRFGLLIAFLKGRGEAGQQQKRTQRQQEEKEFGSMCHLRLP